MSFSSKHASNMSKGKARLYICLELFIVLYIQGFFSPVESLNLVSLKEGEAADLAFQYDYVPDVDIQIRIGHRTPFYRLKISSEIDRAGLSESQAERFDVTISEPVPNYMIVVHVNIAEVRREDAGTFTCAMYNDGVILRDRTKKMGVTVEYPPGKALCGHVKHFIDTSNGIWTLLKCTAPVGYERGQVECYQSGERVPPWSRPVENATTLTQTIWMKEMFRIFCCTSTLQAPKGRCNCNDYIWDPMAQKEMPFGLNPCPYALPESLSISNINYQKSITPIPAHVNTHEYNTESGDTAIEANIYAPEIELIPFILMIVCLNLAVLVLGLVVVLCRSKTPTQSPSTKDERNGHGNQSKEAHDNSSQSTTKAKNRKPFSSK